MGIPPERVADAASALDRPASPLLSLSVGHTVALPRDLTDDEWDRLLADLRSTFQAAGRVHDHGGSRGWTNGNLHAFVEPTVAGHRLRMGTTKGTARSLLLAGGSMLGVALVLLVVRFFMGGLGDALDGLAILALLGLGSAGAGVLQLPGWSRKRRRQMEEIGERVRGSMAELPEEEDRGAPGSVRSGPDATEGDS